MRRADGSIDFDSTQATAAFAGSKGELPSGVDDSANALKHGVFRGRERSHVRPMTQGSWRGREDRWGLGRGDGCGVRPRRRVAMHCLWGEFLSVGQVGWAAKPMRIFGNAVASNRMTLRGKVCISSHSALFARPLGRVDQQPSPGGSQRCGLLSWHSTGRIRSSFWRC